MNLSGQELQICRDAADSRRPENRATAALPGIDSANSQ
jgi:hypothetical protein